MSIETTTRDDLKIGDRTIVGMGVIKPEEYARSAEPLMYFSGRDMTAIPEEERMFFVAESAFGTTHWMLVMHEDDPRRSSAWRLTDAPDHFAWNIERSVIEVTLFEEEVVDTLLVDESGEVFLKTPDRDQRVTCFRLSRTEDAPMWAVEQNFDGWPGLQIARDAGFNYAWAIGPEGLPKNLKPYEAAFRGGDWFTWGSQTAWYRLDRATELHYRVDARFYTGDSAVQQVSETFTREGVDQSIIHVRPSPEADIDPAILRFEGIEPKEPKVEEPVSTLMSALREEIETLKAQVESERRAKIEAVLRHEADIEAISDRLLQECERRDWCSEYDEVVESLNLSLNVPLRDREFEFEVDVDVVVRITRTVTSRSIEDAEREVREDIDMAEVNEGEIRSSEVADVTRL